MPGKQKTDTLTTNKPSKLLTYITIMAAIVICSQLVLPTAFLYGVLDSSTSQKRPFIESYFYPNSIIVAFCAEEVGNRDGRITFKKDDGTVITHIESFNKIAAKYGIVDLEQLYTHVTYPEWNNDGVYIQNIYRITTKTNNNIEEVQYALQRDKSILFAEYETINRTRQHIPNDPEYHRQWHHQQIGSQFAWDYVRGDKEIIVAITDTGAKWNHPDLQDNIWINEAELPGITIDWDRGDILGRDGIDRDGNGKIDDVIGWDFFHDNNNPYQNYPGNHHGTHVAGTVGAVGNNEIGVTGAAMHVSLMTCKGTPSNAESDGVRHGYSMIQYAAQSGAHIINCSWGGPGDGNHANSVIDYAHALGSLVVAAAGNNDSEHTASYTTYPANARNAMNIAATDRHDKKARFSDYGQDIDLSAPGVNILSTYGDNQYHSTSGTSMAAPLVSGVAALVLSLHPEFTPTQLRTRLVETADYIDELNPGYQDLLGSGRLNAFAATMYDKTPNVSLFDYEIQEYDGDGDGVPNPGEEIDLMISLYNEINWKQASDVRATLSSNEPGVEILVDSIEMSDIFGGSVSFNTGNPLRFRTPETLSELVVPLTLTVEANHDQEFPYRVDIDFVVELSLSKAGWPLSIDGSSSSPALITDINANLKREIIFGDSGGMLHVVKEDRSYLPGFPVDLESNINSAVAAADLNNNNRVEIVANTFSGFIKCVDNQGNILFSYEAEGQFRNNPMIVDVNNDGNYEIIALSFTNPHLFVLRADGSDYPGFPLELDSGVMSSPASADLSGDGTKEIIFVDAGGNLHAVSVATQQNVAGFPVSINATSWSGPTIGDLTGNNEPDIVVANIQGSLSAHNRTGETLFTRSIGSTVRSGVLVFDLNHDGQSEIIFGDMSGSLYVLDSAGNQIEPFPLDVGAPVEGTPVLADMTRNLNYDIIFGDGDGWLHSINLQGENTPNFPINLRRSFEIGPTIGYVGEVDNVDILIPNQNGYQYVDFKRPIGTIGWGTFKGNIRRSGNSFDMVSVEDEYIREPELKTRLKGNFPNPFNPNTTIEFSIGEDNPIPVNLSIFNIRGQKIATLIEEYKSTGKYYVNWNGRDDNGNLAGSGVYFYMLRTGETEAAQTKRMILVK